MLRVSDEYLKQTEQEGKFGWQNQRISRHYDDKGRAYYLPSTNSPYLFKCIKCSTPHKPGKCSNCGNIHYELGQSDKRIGIFCSSCERGFTEWVCTACGTSNPVSNTFYMLVKQGYCFIATAVYGTPIADEVIILKEFRDNFLLKNYLGKQFVRLYYRFSPRIAEYIANSNFLKNIIRSAMITPFVKSLKFFKKNRSIS